MRKTLVLYVFHIYNERVQHFLSNCIFYDETVDFIIISNNKDVIIEPPNYTNVKTLYRDNIGYDFGGWSDALLIDNLYKNYDHFIFVNSSVIGPYIYETYRIKWTDIYIGGLRDNIKLYGSTINTWDDPVNKAHVQSYIFALDITTLEYLIKCSIFTMDTYTQTRDETVQQKEVLMSRKIIENGWNIGSLFAYYNGVDFTFLSKHPSEYNLYFLDDIMYPEFQNKLWNNQQLVFIKGNRFNNNLRR